MTFNVHDLRVSALSQLIILDCTFMLVAMLAAMPVKHACSHACETCGALITTESTESYMQDMLQHSCTAQQQAMCELDNSAAACIAVLQHVLQACSSSPCCDQRTTCITRIACCLATQHCCSMYCMHNSSRLSMCFQRLKCSSLTRSLQSHL